MTLSHILVFQNTMTQYEVLHHFRQSLCRALEKQGVRISLVGTKERQEKSFTQILYSDPPDCTLAFNGLAPSPSGHFLAEEIELPHIAWLVDSAHHFPFMAKCHFNILITPDETSCKLLKNWGAAHAFFLPHAVDAEIVPIPNKEKEYDIVFLGSLIDYLEIEERWRSNLPNQVFTALYEAGEKTLTTPDLTYQEAFEAVAESHPDYFQALTPQQIIDHAVEFDLYIRGKDRVELIKALKDFEIHLFGNALSKRTWGDYLDLKHSRLFIHPAVHYSDALSIMQKSRIVLNSSPMFKTGAHERIFCGLAAGALVLTGDTPWIKEHFVEGKEILIYRPSAWEKTRENLAELLKNPDKIASLAEAGREKVQREHTWDVRAGQLLQILEKELETFEF